MWRWYGNEDESMNMGIRLAVNYLSTSQPPHWEAAEGQSAVYGMDGDFCGHGTEIAAWEQGPG